MYCVGVLIYHPCQIAWALREVDADLGEGRRELGFSYLIQIGLFISALMCLIKIKMGELLGDSSIFPSVS